MFNCWTLKPASFALISADVHRSSLVISCLYYAFWKNNWLVTQCTCGQQSWKRHGSYCYLIGTAMKTFDEAKSDCETSGSYLADVSNGLEPSTLSHCWCCSSCVCTSPFIQLDPNNSLNLFVYFQGGQCLSCQFGGFEAWKTFLVRALKPEKYWWICMDPGRLS